MTTAQTACLRVARTINGVEDDIDELLGKAGELLSEIARARDATGHTAYQVQRPLTRIANLQRSLIEARSELVRARGVGSVAHTLSRRKTYFRI